MEISGGEMLAVGIIVIVTFLVFGMAIMYFD